MSTHLPGFLQFFRSFCSVRVKIHITNADSFNQLMLIAAKSSLTMLMESFKGKHNCEKNISKIVRPVSATASMNWLTH